LILRGVPADKISVIYNWCDEAQISGQGVSVARGLDEWSDKFLVIFAGVMGATQGLDAVLDAAELVARRRPAVHFLFIGGGTEVKRLMQEVSARQLFNVSFAARVPVRDIGPVLARADALLVHLKDYPLFRITIPSKTQAYMAAGRPILMAVRGDAEALVQEANCGITCDPENPTQLAKAIEKLAAMSGDERLALGDNGRRFYDSMLSLRAGTQKFAAAFTKPISNEPAWRTFYQRHGKRAFDAVMSSCGLILLAPILAIVAFLVRVKLGSPVMFRQQRPGLRGTPFVLMKFRTMTERRDGAGTLLPDGERLTPFGRFLRATSLDEFPELFNVFRGDMSLVGPRPLLMQYLERYTPEQARRHKVKPGITGWAQINGRNSLNWSDKFRLDVWYVDHYSFLVDCRVLSMTCWKVLSRQGITHPGHVTTEEFKAESAS
jgi:lipopolysaccharide/colanic/teichoic acid biosynthesis glycosyltransferase